mmetsp:Transcript_55687/g.144811  ORF Transcript_55687/g.144811 Transcript_55687/m.144811 type:complete len:83 (-) Transcript_55687:2-250(-)
MVWIDILVQDGNYQHKLNFYFKDYGGEPRKGVRGDRPSQQAPGSPRIRVLELCCGDHIEAMKIAPQQKERRSLGRTGVRKGK